MDPKNTATPPEAGATLTGGLGVVKDGKSTGRTFKFFTGATKAYIVKDASGNDQYYIEGIASSNVRDRYGDTMSAQCQASMLDQAKKLTMWLNHSYDVPEDCGGFCNESSLEAAGDTIDLAIKMRIAQSNPRAMKSWELINKDGVTLAFSIGGIITDAAIDEDNDDGSSWWPPLIINDLELLEISLVGIPANPRAYTRSFIEDIKKTAFKSAQRDPGVTKALLRSIGVKGLEDEFVDLRDADEVNDAAAATAETVETVDQTVQQQAPSDGVAKDGIELPADGVTREVDLGTEGDPVAKSLEDFQREVAEAESQRDAIVADITTKTSERDVLLNEIKALEEKAATLKATPTGRQTNASAGGSSNAAPDLTKMSQAELDAHTRSLKGQASDSVITQADA